MADIKLLDCTLRDGGYVNNWQWGFGSARRIIQTLTRAGVDIVEVGFLRNVDGYDSDVTVCNTIEELNRLLPDEGQRGHTMYSGMAMRSNYDIAKLSPYDGHGIEIIRITAHDYDIKDGMDFARRIKELGYKVSINPINIMGYSDKDLLWIFEQVNEIHPWQFSIVDTFGSMRRRDLDRIVSMADHNLAPDIRLALHLHENMALSFCLAQEFLDKHLRRDLAVDGSLMGMGRIPGNLPIELIADYMNEYFGGHYNIDDLMDAIQDHIAPIKGNCAWGYTPAYFLSAKFNLHPFIVTLATQLIVYGTLLIYLMQGNNNGQSISGLDKSYTNLITGSILSVPDGKGNMVPIPNFVWYAIVITVVMWFVWNKTTFGKNMFAVGSNPEAANVSGVNVAATTILVFTLAGVMYGFTGFIEGARIGANTANTGLNYELDAIAACVIGGVSFVGGIGKIRGVIIGVVLLRIIFVGLTFMSVSSNLQYIIKGLIILVACAIDMRKYLVRK